jgi:hypothetical protein
MQPQLSLRVVQGSISVASARKRSMPEAVPGCVGADRMNSISRKVPNTKAIFNSSLLAFGYLHEYNPFFYLLNSNSLNLYRIKIQVPARDLAMMCVKVENQIVGAPCGTMDQVILNYLKGMAVWKFKYDD